MKIVFWLYAVIGMFLHIYFPKYCLSAKQTTTAAEESLQDTRIELREALHIVQVGVLLVAGKNAATVGGGAYDATLSVIHNVEKRI